MATDEEILSSLTTVFRDVLDDDELHLTTETTARDVDNWDSLNHVRLMLTVEREFRLKFTAAEIGRLKNVGDLVSMIQRHTH